MTKDVLTVSEVNNYISAMFDTDHMLSDISISGEISNITYHTSGHVYFTLKDESATISGVMFRGSRAKGLTFPVKTGDGVVVSGSVGVYEAAGKYQIYARSFERAGTGELYRRFEELKLYFEEMGMFDESYKRAIPKYAGRIGIVTASTGAAIHDIITTASRRNPHVQLILYPSLVQGEGAAASIAQGIGVLDEMGLDIIIVGRGGGSIEDLWAFNEEEVARAIFACNTPVISAVGHEVDFTIADFVADARAATPTAAAEMAVFEYDNFLDSIDNIKRRLEYALSGKLQLDKSRYKLYISRLNALSPHSTILRYKTNADVYHTRLQSIMKTKLTHSHHALEEAAARLDGLSPAKRLVGGYSYIVGESGNNITKASQLRLDDMIRVYLSEGVLDAKVTKIHDK